MITMVFEESEKGYIKKSVPEWYTPDPNIYQDYKYFESNPRWGISIKVGEFAPCDSSFFKVQTYFDDDYDLTDDDYRNIASHPLPLVSIVACILEKCPKKIAVLTLIPTSNPYKLIHAYDKLYNRWRSNIADLDLISLVKKAYLSSPHSKYGIT
jgi:hypothetical protein